MLRYYTALALAVWTLSACGGDNSTPGSHASVADTTAVPPATSAAAASQVPQSASAGARTVAEDESSRMAGLQTARRAPNLLGKVPILEYHLIGESDGRWTRSRASFRNDLQMLYDAGYRPVSVSDMVDKRIDLPAGISPVVFTFDDASPSQFRFIEENGEFRLDPTSALGIWLDFRKTHPDWSNRAVFCMLSGAEAGRSFFGDKGIEGQKSEWRHRKLRILADSGFELCNHTVWHANLAKQSDSLVINQIARLNLAIDSAVPKYRVRTFALPLGEWPSKRELAQAGSWKDARTGRITVYSFDAVLQVSGGLARSPHDPLFDPLRLPRVQVFGEELPRVLAQLERGNQRYVSDGARPPK